MFHWKNVKSKYLTVIIYLFVQVMQGTIKQVSNEPTIDQSKSVEIYNNVSPYQELEETAITTQKNKKGNADFLISLLEENGCKTCPPSKNRCWHRPFL